MHLHQLPRPRLVRRPGLALPRPRPVRAAAALVVALGGCSAWSERPPTADASADRTLDDPLENVPFDAPVIDEAEPNDDFDAPLSAPTLRSSGLFINGGLSDWADVDLYSLGPVEAGGRVTVRIDAPADVHLQAALFDDREVLLTAARSSTSPIGRTVTLSHVARTSMNDCVLAVAAQSARRNAVGGYAAAVAFESDVALPTAAAQTVVLNFAGAEPHGDDDFTDRTVAPFDASDISPQFGGLTDDIRDLVVALVRDQYAGLAVDVVAWTEPIPWPDGVSVVHVGAVDDEYLLGVGEHVDEYNADPADEAFVFVDAFAQFMPLGPSADDIAIAIANVAGHETGHLLGLRHTVGAGSLMDVSASLGHVLRARAFGVWPLDAESFPIGYQDEPAMLAAAVGENPDSPPPEFAGVLSLKGSGAWTRWPGGIPVRPLSSCGMGCGGDETLDPAGRED